MHTQSYTLVSGLIQEGGCNGLILLGKLIYFWQFVLIINGVTLVTSFMLNNEIICVRSQTSMGDGRILMSGKVSKQGSRHTTLIDFVILYLGFGIQSEMSQLD